MQIINWYPLFFSLPCFWLVLFVVEGWKLVAIGSFLAQVYYLLLHLRGFWRTYCMLRYVTFRAPLAHCFCVSQSSLVSSPPLACVLRSRLIQFASNGKLSLLQNRLSESYRDDDAAHSLFQRERVHAPFHDSLFSLISFSSPSAPFWQNATLWTASWTIW